jgi:hypothetical protein
MPRIMICLVFCMIRFTTAAQPAFTGLLDSLVDRAQETSLYTKSIQWDSLRKEVHKAAIKAASISELKPAFETLLNGLKDMHGKIIDAKTYQSLAYFTDYEKLNHPDKRPRDPDTRKIVNDRKARFESKILPGNIGYLKMMGIAPQCVG